MAPNIGRANSNDQMDITYNENHNEHRKNNDKETDTTNLIEFSNENDLICENGV